MKLIRLLFVLLMILGVAIGVCFLLFDGNDNKSDVASSKDDLLRYRKQFNNQWIEKDDWDEDLFLEHTKIIDELAKGGSCVDALRELNTKKAIELLFRDIMMEWESPTCDKATIDKYVNAVKQIEDYDISAKKDIDLLLLKEINEVYKKAYGIASKKVALEPDFNGSAWNSFSSYSNSLLSQRQTIINEAVYQKYLSNISMFKAYFEELPELLKEARADFSKKLLGQILSHFQKLTKNSANLSRIQSVRARYSAEFSSNASLDTLVRQYAVAVQQQSMAKKHQTQKKQQRKSGR